MLPAEKFAANSVLYAIDETKTCISKLHYDAEFEISTERTEALKTSNKETDTKATPSKRRRRFASLAKGYEGEFRVCGFSDKNVEFKTEYFAIINQVLSRRVLLWAKVF